MTDLLFTPLTIGTLEVKNRIFMPAMHLNMARNYQVTDRLLDFYAARAQGGAGMITVGYASVDELSAYPAHIGAHRDEYLPGLASLAKVIQQGGARAALQLNHAGRYNHSMALGGEKPVAPSPIASRLTGETPRELTTDEIQQIIAAFAAAAVRVKTAGFDAVEILAGTGYLISEFLSPLTNQRDDQYGGALENRMRFGLEVVQAVRRQVGDPFPLVVRINGNDFMPGGIGRKALQLFAVQLVAAGADALCVNVGWHEATVPQIVTKVPRADVVLLATGGQSIQPTIPGAKRPQVLQAWEVLGGKTKPGRRVVIIGGGAVGVETALALAEEGTLSAEALKFLLVHGAESCQDLLELATRGSHEVILVEMLKDLGGNFGKTTRWGMLQDLRRYGVQTRVATKVIEITSTGLIVEDTSGREELTADSVVLAVGTQPHNSLLQRLQQQGISCQVIGDAGQVGMVIDAIHQGFKAGRSLA